MLKANRSSTEMMAPMTLVYGVAGDTHRTLMLEGNHTREIQRNWSTGIMIFGGSTWDNIQPKKEDDIIGQDILALVGETNLVVTVHVDKDEKLQQMTNGWKFRHAHVIGQELLNGMGDNLQTVCSEKGLTLFHPRTLQTEKPDKFPDDVTFEFMVDTFMGVMLIPRSQLDQILLGEPDPDDIDGEKQEPDYADCFNFVVMTYVMATGSPITPFADGGCVAAVGRSIAAKLMLVALLTHSDFAKKLPVDWHDIQLYMDLVDDKTLAEIDTNISLDDMQNEEVWEFFENLLADLTDTVKYMSTCGINKNDNAVAIALKIVCVVAMEEEINKPPKKALLESEKLAHAYSLACTRERKDYLKEEHSCLDAFQGVMCSPKHTVGQLRAFLLQHKVALDNIVEVDVKDFKKDSTNQAKTVVDMVLQSAPRVNILDNHRYKDILKGGFYKTVKWLGILPSSEKGTQGEINKINPEVLKMMEDHGFSLDNPPTLLQFIALFLERADVFTFLVTEDTTKRRRASGGEGGV